jgi:hypothetical protein
VSYFFVNDCKANRFASYKKSFSLFCIVWEGGIFKGAQEKGCQILRVGYTTPAKREMFQDSLHGSAAGRMLLIGLRPDFNRRLLDIQLVIWSGRGTGALTEAVGKVCATFSIGIYL